ncbi:hypothetical protein K402DRAFT_455493 [Aulographum hederae CBS 113979]|uniref:DUF572-domain-containing protein n=1 Tax=Aulographum hederae CBS 113979 TaxID=1176131 RepID=A0A6G1GVV5_9PEZI|nr:hypothetical protein K402DRAFT_455493 [Aulographum hederae CBS 113979]
MQGFNMGRYIPPSALDPSLSGSSYSQKDPLSANAASGKGHALGARARKLKSEGILIVRFEMPFAIWCSSCAQPTIIGQGVRFNAEKKRVGRYLSSPIWGFRMRHAECGGTVEMRTDPENEDIVVHEGGVRRDYGGDRGEDGEVVREVGGVVGVGEGARVTEQERERRVADAFRRLEGRKVDVLVKDTSKRRIEELVERGERDWEDPFEVNSRLRDGFRKEKKRQIGIEKADEAVKDKFGLDVQLVQEVEEDRIRAGVVEFGALGWDDEEAERRIRAKPMFAERESKTKTAKEEKKSRTLPPTKKEAEKERAAKLLRAELRSNTRASMDPFLNPSEKRSKPFIPGLKKKVKTEDAQEDDLDASKSADESKGASKQPLAEAETEKRKPSVVANPMLALVEYGYDSD